MESHFKIIIAGSRDFSSFKTLEKFCNAVIPSNVEVTIISGGARGADKLGERYARKYGYKLEIYPAEWGTYGRAAGPIRNEQMAAVATHLIAFWDGSSPGTSNMINLAHSKGLETRICYYMRNKNGSI